MTEQHRTVLLEEVVAELAPSSRAIVVDATAGGGGHALALREKLGQDGVLVVMDADRETLAKARTRLEAATLTSAPQTHYVCRNFRELAVVLAELEISQVDAIIADLGWNSEQFEHGGKGFSFKPEHHEEPLHMTFGNPEDALFTARDIVMGWKEEDIANVLYGYGEERYSRRIARAITERRRDEPIETVGALVATIEGAVPAGYRNGRIHPATKSFQALRIAVNDELGALKALLESGVEALGNGGRLAIITFHSIEDRIVKQAFREYAKEGRGKVVTKRPITASREELTRNPRARSAKLRVFEKNHA